MAKLGGSCLHTFIVVKTNFSVIAAAFFG